MRDHNLKCTKCLEVVTVREFDEHISKQHPDSEKLELIAVAILQNRTIQKLYAHVFENPKGKFYKNHLELFEQCEAMLDNAIQDCWGQISPNAKYTEQQLNKIRWAIDNKLIYFNDLGRKQFYRPPTSVIAYNAGLPK